jgi:hypothetical protein
MADQKVDGAGKPAEKEPVGTAAEKAFENEGGAPHAPSPATPASESLMDRIEHAAGRVKARLTGRSS